MEMKNKPFQQSNFLRINFIFHSLLGNYSESLSDSKVAIELQPSFVKAILRGK